MSAVKNLPDKAKDWKAGGEGAKSGKPLMRAPDTIPFVRQPLTDERKTRFLENLAKFGTVQKAAEMTDGNPDTRRTYMRAMAKDAAFGELADNALAKHTQRRLDVLDEEFFEGTLVPVTNSKGLVIDPETKKPIWIRKRDPKIVLAVAKRHDWGLREVKTTINVDGSSTQADASDPEIRVKHSDLLRLPQADMETLKSLLQRVYDSRNEALAAMPDRPDYIDDVPYTDITPSTDESEDLRSNEAQADPYAIPEGGI